MKFHISYPLINGILRTEYTGFEEQKKRVEELFSKHKEKIMQGLRRLGYPIEEHDFWLANGECPVSPNPNILNVNKKDEILLFDLVYLMVHNVFYDNDIYDNFATDHGIDETKLEAAIYFVTIKILKEIIPTDFVEELRSDKFNRYIWDEVDQINSSNLRL